MPRKRGRNNRVSRSWAGCITCRRRHIKCDQRSPACHNCERSNRVCLSGDSIVFRHAQKWPDSQSAADCVWLSVETPLKFIDETDLTTLSYRVLSPEKGLLVEPTGTEAPEAPNRAHLYPRLTGSDANLPRHYSPPTNCQHIAGQDSQSPSANSIDSVLVPDASVQPQRSTATCLSSPKTILHPLSSARNFPYDSSHSDNSGGTTFNESINLISPSSPSGNDLTAHYFHVETTLLRSQYLQESIHPSCAIPVFTVNGHFQVRNPLRDIDEARLLWAFSFGVGQWMDLSDLKEPFSKQIPCLSRQDSLVKQCAISCAAKQLSLVNALPDGMEVAQKYYGSAITQLITRLNREGLALSTPTFAAVVICSVYEMFDGTGTEWQSHLEGIHQLGQAKGVNGSCGGLEQAVFWCFARQEVVCSLINQNKLRLNPNSWGISLTTIGVRGEEDLINCQVLTILAKIVDFMASRNNCGQSEHNADDGKEQYESLTKLLYHWKSSLPDTCQPFFINEEGCVFPKIWFPYSTSASSWQMYHLARILLLSSWPCRISNILLEFRKIESELRHHATQICGIAESKPSPGCRVHSVQAIYYAGCCFSNEREQRRVIKLLEDIEDELGWTTNNRIRDLHKQWGW